MNAHAAPTIAAQIVASDRTRRDDLIDGRLVYAIGDIHGCYGQLKILLRAIVADALLRAGSRTPVIIFCGDYIDRGPQSSRVIEALCWLDRHRPCDLHFLKGNHEAFFTDYIRDPRTALSWADHGGRETMASYGVTPPPIGAPLAGHIRARDDLLAQIPISHLLFLESLELIVTVGDYAFVHAGVRSTVPLEEQDEEDLLWIRDGFLDHRGAHEKIIVHGHSWRDERPVIEQYRIGIDTGAYETGVLTALRIEDGEIEILQAR